MGRASLIENENLAEDMEKVEAGPMEDRALIALCFLFSSFVMCALYFAFLYDPTRTVTPS